MKELKVTLLTEDVTNEQIEILDNFLMKLFNTDEIVITSGNYKE